MGSRFKVAVVGATGAVGGEFLKLFEERDFPVASLRLLASERSAGKSLAYRGEQVPVESVSADTFSDIDFAFFSAGASRSRDWVPAALAAGATVIDNSSAFRMRPDVPLVVPEVNGEEILPDRKLFAVPNCTAIILTVAVHPLASLGKIRRLVVSTYQSASGGGAAMMRELEDQTKAIVTGADHSRNESFPPYAFNLFSHNTPINEAGYNEEEWKVIEESRKILGMPDLAVNVTCVRVPILRAHSESVTVEFDGAAPDEGRVREALAQAPGIRLVDDRARNHFPTPHEAGGQGDVLVGRIRRDVSHPSAICMFIAGDQLLKGAALNAVQIAERLIQVGQPAGAWA